MQSCSEFADISDASLCRRSSIAMTETSGNLSASRDFGTSSQDSLLSAIPEDENDSETAEESSDIVEVKGSEAIEILDLTESQEDIDILDVKDSQRSVDILEVKGSSVEILDLQDSQESVDILDGEDSHETVAEAQNVSGQNSKSSTIFDVTEDAASVQERSNTIDEELAQFSWQNKYENDSAVQENFNYQTIPEETLDSKRTQSAAIESCTNSFSYPEIVPMKRKPSIEQEGFREIRQKNSCSSPKEETSSKTHSSSTHRDFSAALRQVLGRCNQVNFEDDTDLRHTDILERYRQLRSRDLREENQAAIVTSDKSCMKIIMDVHDFMSGDVQAKSLMRRSWSSRTCGEEGRRNLIRNLSLLQTPLSLPQFTKITSVMSLDGILTVTVMFKETTSTKYEEDTQAVTSSEDERHYKFVIDVHDFMDVGEISVKAVNERELVEGHLEKKEDGSKSSKRFLRRFVVPGDIELEAVISVMSSDGVLKILAPKKEGHNRKHFSIDVEDMDDVEATVSRKFRNGHRLAEEYLKKRDSSSDDEELRAFAKQSNNHTESLSKTMTKSLKRGEVFAEDYCFANVRNSFSQAVREVLEKASEWTCRSDAMHNYRRLRQRDLKLENQAVGILDDQDSHKIVMDVFDFMKGDVTVQLVKGKELLVEGQAERQDGGRVSRVSFVRRFALPELVERDAISCVLSSDGILTITCRKRASGYSARGFCSERKPHVDTAGGWEDKDAKDSLADWEGASSRAFSTGSRSRYHRSYVTQY
ncbi:heat shock protein 21 [Penaeus vannamei]|uniref:Heat shock protein 21 n=1 Tax=Penaeus vannamei TaxID=6689 RepID=A0A423SDN3_PENVA|nr:heat shock protein 21 [Penaeus vannamei]